MDSLAQWYTGEVKLSDAFLSRVYQFAKHEQHVAESTFAALVPTVALYSKAVVHIVDFFLKDERDNERRELARLARENTTESDDRLYAFAREALRKLL